MTKQSIRMAVPGKGLAFLAGSLWGNAVNWPDTAKPARLIASNLFAVLAAGAALIPSLSWSIATLGALHLALLAYELAYPKQPGWYPRLRMRLTGVACISHLVVLFLLA